MGFFDSLFKKNQNYEDESSQEIDKYHREMNERYNREAQNNAHEEYFSHFLTQPSKQYDNWWDNVEKNHQDFEEHDISDNSYDNSYDNSQNDLFKANQSDQDFYRQTGLEEQRRLEEAQRLYEQQLEDDRIRQQEIETLRRIEEQQRLDEQRLYEQQREEDFCKQQELEEQCRLEMQMEEERMREEEYLLLQSSICETDWKDNLQSYDEQSYYNYNKDEYDI